MSITPFYLGRPLNIAHRGARDSAPENTLEGCRLLEVQLAEDLPSGIQSGMSNKLRRYPSGQKCSLLYQAQLRCIGPQAWTVQLSKLRCRLTSHGVSPGGVVVSWW